MNPEINRSYETRGGEEYEADEEVRSAHKRGRRDPEAPHYWDLLQKVLDPLTDHFVNHTE
jgi:hypothetical protein